MRFIPQEIKEQMTRLEDENKRLAAENSHLKRDIQTKRERKSGGAAAWILAVLLVAALAFIAYQQFVIIPGLQEAAKPVEEEPNAVIMRDGNIEKWNRVSDSALVYRVQLGAYAEFDLNAYKQNIEGLYQDSIDGFHKVSLGAFSRLADAQQFQRNMVRMGLENVYIVAYEGKQPIGLIEAKQEESTQHN
jgi:hypothetical protein